MKEIKDIIQAFDEAQKLQQKTALATVVHVDGSSYRRPGARMLITEDGHLTGAISGGCLEGDALRKALLAIMENQKKLVTYDTNDEDDAKFGLGLGCNGIIQVLIEPIDSANPDNPVQLLKRVVAKREKATLVTLFSLQNKRGIQYGTCFLIKADETFYGALPLQEQVIKTDARKTLSTRQSAFKNYISQDQNITAFIEFLNPPISLVIIGAGNDVLPLVKIGDTLGWQTTVVDKRPFYSKQPNLGGSCQVLAITPEDILKQVPPDEQTAFVLMTHNYNYDLSILRELLKQDISYIGILGPKKKYIRMIEELQNEGVELTDQQRSTIYSPVGVDIGAETSEEIALSIAAEIKAVLAKRQPLFLKDKNDSIHARSETIIETIKIDTP